MEDYKKAIIDSLSIKVGDWTYGDVGDGFGQITQIIPCFFEEYDNNIPKGKSVGDYEGFCLGIVKYFCTEEKVRRNGVGLKRITQETKPIVEGDIYGYWDIIQKHIKDNPEKYLAYQKYKPKLFEGHYHIGYSAGPRFGKPEHTKEFYIELFDKIRKDLPSRFTFADLMDIAAKHQCPLKLDNPTPHGYQSTMDITLFFNVGECQGKRQLFSGLGNYICFGHYFYEAPIIPTHEEVIERLRKELEENKKARQAKRAAK